MNKGILLVNLGSPDSTKVSDVRKYLREFLTDPKVIDYPYIIRKFVVEAFILPTRPAKSAEAYEKVWTPEGSPLVVTSEKFTQKLKSQTDIPVALGMRYGSMSIQKGLQELYDQDVKDILVIPLYPQYTMSSTETVIDKANEVQKKYFKDVHLTFLKPFYNHPDYINVLAKDILSKLPEDFDNLLFSFHGIPERHDKKALASAKKHPDLGIKTYRDQCFETAELVRLAMGLEEDQVTVSFQSRLGRDPWIKPYTDFVLEDFPKEGIKKLAVVAPAFVSDCLETLEEINMTYNEQFIEAGGESFEYLSCLNTSDEWVDVVVKWIDGWKNRA